MPKIASTELDVFPLCLGGNVFGWTADEAESFAVLDAYVEAGGNFVDTADQYSEWVPGNSGGESESILGRWMASRGNRDDVVIATKVGKLTGRQGLSAATIRAAAEDSLRRLRTDRIDLYWAHRDDEDTPQEETLEAFDQLVRAGKVRSIGASNFGADRLSAALEVSQREGFARYVALQNEYNLMARAGYEAELAELCVRADVSMLPYYGLAAGFLTGKYRTGGTADADGASPRAGQASAYLSDPRATAVLDSLDEVASAHGTSVAAVALAWLRARPAVLAPIASARTVEQLRDLLAAAQLLLSHDELSRLDAASAA
jgi:aryl-alcohol dehydrogenase-like predicted oxidoreductase